MFKFSLIAVIHLIAVLVHFVSESLAAILAHYHVPHQHFCLVYLVAAIASLMLMIVAIVEECRKSK